MNDLQKEIIDIFNNYEKDQIFTTRDIYNDLELDYSSSEKKLRENISDFSKYLLDSGYSSRNEKRGANNIIEYKRIKKYTDTPNIQFSTMFMCGIFNKYLPIDQKFNKNTFFELVNLDALKQGNTFGKEELVLFKRATDGFISSMIKHKLIRKSGIKKGAGTEYIKSYNVHGTTRGSSQKTHYTIQSYKEKLNDDIYTLTNGKTLIPVEEEIPEVETQIPETEIQTPESEQQVPEDYEESQPSYMLSDEESGRVMNAYTNMLRDIVKTKEDTIKEFFSLANKKDKIISDLQDQVKYAIDENTHLVKDNQALKIKIKDLFENVINDDKVSDPDKELQAELERVNTDYASLENLYETLKLKTKEYGDKIRTLIVENDSFKEMNEELEKRMKNKNVKKVINITDMEKDIKEFKKDLPRNRYDRKY